ncbi:unnamed protein product, partial [Larinioides sclopetarius]
MKFLFILKALAAFVAISAVPQSLSSTLNQNIGAFPQSFSSPLNQNI